MDVETETSLDWAKDVNIETPADLWSSQRDYLLLKLHFVTSTAVGFDMNF